MVIRPQDPDKLTSFLSARPLILYGMGDTGKRIAEWCDGHGVRYLISDQRAEEMLEKGVPGVVLPQAIAREHKDANVVISSIAYVREIKRDLLTLGIEQERVLEPFLFMPDQVTLTELEAHGQVDWERMSQRCEMVAGWGWIPSEIRSVVDYSAGEGFLIKKYLPQKAVYHPVDYLDRGENTLVRDFSKGEFPDIYAELSVCFAMAMYTRFAVELIDNICVHTQKRSIFTAVTWEGLPDVKLRRYSAMVSDLTEQQILDRFGLNSFSPKEKRCHTAGNSTMTFYLFEKQ